MTTSTSINNQNHRCDEKSVKKAVRSFRNLTFVGVDGVVFSPNERKTLKVKLKSKTIGTHTSIVKVVDSSNRQQQIGPDPFALS